MGHESSFRLSQSFIQGGLVIVSAKYGHSDAIQEAEQLEMQSRQNGAHETEEITEEASTSRAFTNLRPWHSRYMPAALISGTELQTLPSQSFNFARWLKTLRPYT